MKFYVIEIAETKEKTTKGVYDYATLDEAVASFHTKLGGAMKNPDYLSELLIVINSDGGVSKNEKWVRQIPEPEIEEVTE